MSTLITNISKLLHIEDQGRKYKRGHELSHFPITQNAWLKIDNKKISAFGSMQNCPTDADEIIDAKGGMVYPGYVDSHTHLVYAATREEEFAMKLKGMSYEQIAAAGGGILNSVKKLRNTTEDELYASAERRLIELIKLGTTAIEIKSGYGLDTASEMKMLRVAQRLSENHPIRIKKTFLGAHAVPPEFSGERTRFVEHIVNDMLPQIAAENLCDYVDVFCEKGYFTVDDTLKIIQAATAHGLKCKLHVNQFNILGIIEKAVVEGVLSVDHLEVLSDDEAKILGKSETIATLLPGCSFYTEIPYGPARKLIEQNAIIALASDYNPGSAPSGNLSLALSLACVKMKMTPEEALSALTLNGAAALELSDEMGSIEIGKTANLIITRPHISPAFIPYNFGHNCIDKVLLNGVIYE